MTRRYFLNKALSFWTLITALPFVYAIIKYFYPEGRYYNFRIRNNPELIKKEFSINDVKENSFMHIVIDEKPLLVIRNTGNDIIVMDGTCTHLDCLIGYRKEFNDIYCKCHEGTFDINGTVLSGPPKRNLKKYNIEIKDNIVKIKDI